MNRYDYKTSKLSCSYISYRDLGTTFQFDPLYTHKYSVMAIILIDKELICRDIFLSFANQRDMTACVNYIMNAISGNSQINADFRSYKINNEYRNEKNVPKIFASKNVNSYWCEDPIPPKVPLDFCKKLSSGSVDKDNMYDVIIDISENVQVGSDNLTLDNIATKKKKEIVFTIYRLDESLPRTITLSF